MSFVKKPGGWQDGLGGGTPLNALGLNDLEDRIDSSVSALEGNASGLIINVTEDPYNALPGVPAASAGIQAAIDAASSAGGGAVFFPAGVYNIDTRLDLSSNVKLMGAPGAVLDFSSVTATGSANICVRAQGQVGSSVSLSANATKGQFTVSVGSVSGLGEGDWIRLSSSNEYGYDVGYNTGEIKQIRDITGTTLTFEQALYDSYATADSAVVAKVSMVNNVTVTGLKFAGANTAANNDRALTLEFVNGFFVFDCEFDEVDQYCVYVRSSIRGDVSHNRMRGVFYDGVTGTIFYGILLSSATQWVRVHANHGEMLRHLVVTSAATADPGAPRHITVTGNVAQNMMAGGAGRSWAYEHHGVGENIIFSGNVADGCYGGFVTRGPGVSFIGNTVRNWYAYALHIHPDIEDCRDILISGNTVADRSKDGGSGFATPACVRAELAAATVIRNVVIADNILTQDVTGQPAIKADGATITADSFVVRTNTIHHPSASVDSISLEVNGAVRRGNVVNGDVEGDDTIESALSSDVTTLPRQFIGTTMGTIAGGQVHAARARCRRGGTFTKIRFATGTTAPSGLTDVKAGVWSTTNDTLLAATADEDATVTAASTVYTLNLTAPITLKAGDEVYLGVGFVGTTPPSVRGNTGLQDVLALSPKIGRRASAWAGGTLPTLTTDAFGIPWVELVV
jgi:uncharacterized cupin superfamily protein